MSATQAAAAADLSNYQSEYQKHLNEALEFGMTEENAQKYAYEKTAYAHGYYL